MDTILIADDNDSMREMLARALQAGGFRTETASDGEEACRKISSQEFDMVITDLRMPKQDGMEVLRHAKKLWPSILVLVITAHGTVDSAVSAMKEGAGDYLAKPFSVDELETKVAKALEQRRIRMQRDFLADRVRSSYGRIVGESSALRELKRLVEKVAPSLSPVLILGESGTGKELFAREIHETGSMREGPFVPVNCAALPGSLIESELFGYEKGAFTGAVGRKRGRFEIADRGTLFLDEIAEIPPEVQVKILRFLQTGEFERVGGLESMRVMTRVIAATNQDIHALLRERTFREDLYYRINVITLRIPSLREHREDIPELVHYFLERLSQELHKKCEIDSGLMEALVSYGWPGNVRELENILERAIVLSDGPVLRVVDLPVEIREFDAGKQTELPASPDLSRKVETLERDLIHKALLKFSWNQSRAAEELGLKRSSLQYKMKKYGLESSHQGQEQEIERS